MAKSGTERLKAYREKTPTERLEIIGLSQELKQAFKNVPGLENVTSAEKLKALIDYWTNGHQKQTVSVLGVLVIKEGIDKPAVKKSYPDNNKAKVPKVTDWNKFYKDFSKFLSDFKMSNHARPKLMTQGKRIRESLLSDREYKKAFKKICEKLPDNILNQFKPMYLQGYFYLYNKEIIEISQQEPDNKIILILFESLRHMGKDEPVKEAKKVLGLIK